MVTVNQRKWPSISKNPSLLGFGCMRFPTLEPGKPEIDEETAQRMIDYAYANGVTYFDTAYPYHYGKSELFIGKALKKYLRESFFLASKMPGWLLHSLEDAKRIFREQLSRCQVEYFDYYLCHALSRDNIKPYEDYGVFAFLNEMKKQGLIRHLGFSFHDTPEVLEEILKKNSWDFVQIQCNYLDWTLQNAKKQYDLIEKSGIPCIIMEPVRGGSLANLSKEANEIFEASDPKSSIASWAIRYVASKSNVLVVLSGMSSMDQTKDNIKTMSDFHPITETEQNVIDRALSAFLKNRTIPCTGCRYCMPCPQGVDIPHMFRLYNEYALSHYADDFLDSYEEDFEHQATHCITCGQCIRKCPQKIDISNQMNKIKELFRSLSEAKKKRPSE